MDIKRRQPIGVELVKRGVVKEEDIENALRYQKSHPNTKIGDCLYELETCDPYILITSIGEILGEKGILLNKNMIKIDISEYISLDIAKKNKVVPFDISIEKVKEKVPKGIIFTGGPASVYGEDSPKCADGIFELGIPVLGICYGMQLMTHTLGGNVARANKREYGTTEVKIDNSSLLFKGFENTNGFLMSHTDYVEAVPEGFINIASTPSCPNAAMENADKKLYGIQFHPEVNSSIDGTQVIKNFLFEICNCTGDWQISSFVDESIKSLKEKIGDKKALCALSGGVDSSVAAVLLNKAIGKNLTCIFVDHGLLRKNEGDEVESVFRNQFDINLIRVNSQERFLNRLAGITEPEEKRKIIGEEFIRVFEEEAKKIGRVNYLVQGTIYPDVIESGHGKAAVIKSHHNVGGLPDYVDFDEIIEPLRDLFKDEVRKTGLEVISYTTLFTCFTSLTILLDTFSNIS